ncbi:MAG: bifunctional oligoribonuclease/PAP phosphatase NrnA [Chloroflexota bacterium]|nr:bifunctional oligoribonuclease/PAP phosphatase NrnA [Chloroflexota bacterium]
MTVTETAPDAGTDVARAASALAAAQRVTVFCHENPDADTIGAGLAVGLIAERQGKAAEVVCIDEPPPTLAFLPGVDRVRRRPALEPDLSVVVDAGDLPRVGGLVTSEWATWLDRARVVNIDHHVSNPAYGTVNLIDPAAAATCEVVAMLLPSLGVPLDAELATVLLSGIVQDTHCFSHPNTTPRTLRVAAELVEAGAPLSAINRAIYLDKPFSTLALWGRMLAGIGQRLDGRIVYAALTREMLAETGAQPSDSEGFVDLLASTRAADVTVLLKQAIDADATRVSVRTTERADAVAIVTAFGGGGHARAAGCTVAAPLPDAQERVLAECARELARSDARGR